MLEVLRWCDNGGCQQMDGRRKKIESGDVVFDVVYAVRMRKATLIEATADGVGAAGMESCEGMGSLERATVESVCSVGCALALLRLACEKAEKI